LLDPMLGTASGLAVEKLFGAELHRRKGLSWHRFDDV